MATDFPQACSRQGPLPELLSRAAALLKLGRLCLQPLQILRIGLVSSQPC